MQTLKRLINNNKDWQAIIAHSVDEALQYCINQKVDMILLGAGIETNEHEELQKKLLEASLSIPVVLHYGGGSGLLYAEIHEGLALRP